MRIFLYAFKTVFVLSAAFLMVVRPANGEEQDSISPKVPTIMMTDATLSQAIELLARQSEINYIVDPKVSFEGVPYVNFRWENLTARQGLERLLKERDLVLVENPATTVARIAPRSLNVKPVDAALVGNDTNG